MGYKLNSIGITEKEMVHIKLDEEFLSERKEKRKTFKEYLLFYVSDTKALKEGVCEIRKVH